VIYAHCNNSKQDIPASYVGIPMLTDRTYAKTTRGDNQLDIDISRSSQLETKTPHSLQHGRKKNSPTTKKIRRGVMLIYHTKVPISTTRKPLQKYPPIRPDFPHCHTLLYIKKKTYHNDENQLVRQVHLPINTRPHPHAPRDGSYHDYQRRNARRHSYCISRRGRRIVRRRR